MLLTYKGFTAEIKYSEEDKTYVGRVKNIDDIISFDSENLDEIENVFRGMIDFYLENGKEANQPLFR